MAWQKGQSGNPQGRQQGTRLRITEAFLREVEDDWRQHGREALVKAREDRPVEYCKMIAGLLPKDVNMTVRTTADMTDDELVSIARTGSQGTADAEGGEEELPRVH